MTQERCADVRSDLLALEVRIDRLKAQLRRERSNVERQFLRTELCAAEDAAVNLRKELREFQST